MVYASFCEQVQYRDRLKLFFYMNGIRLSFVLSPTTHVAPRYLIYVPPVRLKIFLYMKGHDESMKKGHWVVEQLLILPLILWWNLNFFYSIRIILAHMWSPTTILALRYSICDYNSSCKYKHKLTWLTNNRFFFFFWNT